MLWLHGTEESVPASQWAALGLALTIFLTMLRLVGRAVDDKDTLRWQINYFIHTNTAILEKYSF